MKTLSLFLLFFFLFSIDSYSLPDCKGSDPLEWNNCYGTYTSPDGEKYVGEWKDGLSHGKGSDTNIQDLAGVIYEGRYKKGKRNGKGILTIDLFNAKYVGYWKDGLRDGKGISTRVHENGQTEKYEGKWKDNNRHGQGTYTYGDEKYVGEWKDHKRHGKGTRTDGWDKYTGEWKDDKRHGLGTNIFEGLPCEDGSTYDAKYVGEFKNGNRNGQGTLTYKDYKYIGEFKDGRYNGTGTYTWPKKIDMDDIINCGSDPGYLCYLGRQCLKYNGEWKNGKQHGQGTMTYRSGSKDIDEWIDGVPVGWIKLQKLLKKK